MKSLFLDLDGVCCDFDLHVIASFGATPHALGDEKLWSLVVQHPRFWSNMPLMPGALDLWNAAKPYNPIILTGCPKSDFDRAAEHKRQWVAMHLGADVEVITCLSRDKQLHMRASGDVLVDDRHSNIKRWSKAGGVAILYKNATQAIKAMQAAMNRG